MSTLGSAAPGLERQGPPASERAVLQPRPPRALEVVRRRWLGPLFARLGYDLQPTTPDWLHRPLSRREVERLLGEATTLLKADLETAGIGAGEPVRRMVQDFWRLIPQCPVRQRHGGNGFNGALQVYGVARALRPSVIIESGVFRGLTTWILRQACPEARIFCFDPVLAELRHRDSSAHYAAHDWAQHDFAGLDLSNALAFFDDHNSHAQRMAEADARGIQRLLFDDNAAAHRLHAHGGPAFPTIDMILEAPAEPVRWLRNGREFVYAPDPGLPAIRERIAIAHAFDDMHRATGYSPAQLCYVALKAKG